MTLSQRLGVPPCSALHYPSHKRALTSAVPKQRQGYLPARDVRRGVRMVGQHGAQTGSSSRAWICRAAHAAAAMKPMRYQTLAQHFGILPRSALCHPLGVSNNSVHSRELITTQLHAFHARPSGISAECHDLAHYYLDLDRIAHLPPPHSPN
ncbi:hypothetical protein BJV74DRAFT_277365 [Russula compacta]|nr:hypothetical protein BJV74DRAFT_277365 [Russula compacta]